MSRFPNLDQKCTLALLRSLLIWGLIYLDLQFSFIFNFKPVPHSTWPRTYSDSYVHVDRVAPWMVKKSNFISWWDHRSSASADSETGLTALAILYTPHMLKFYKLTFGNPRNNSKTTPISPYFVRFAITDNVGDHLYLQNGNSYLTLTLDQINLRLNNFPQFAFNV